jgi:hypothetical protein
MLRSVRLLPALTLLAVLACRAPAAHPAPSAGPFGWTAGEWRGQRVEAATGEAAPMRLSVRPLLGGAGRIEELEVLHSKGAYRGVHLVLHDAARDVWVSHYANERNGELAPLEGSPDGEAFVWRSVAPARTRESRLVYERAGPDRWRRRQEISSDGAVWQVLFTDELERTSE